MDRVRSEYPNRGRLSPFRYAPSSGPCLVVYPAGTWYSYNSVEDIDTIVAQDILEDKPVQDLLID